MEAIRLSFSTALETYQKVLRWIETAGYLTRVMSEKEADAWSILPKIGNPWAENNLHRENYSWLQNNVSQIYLDQDLSPLMASMASFFPTAVDKTTGRRVVEAIRFFSLDGTHKFNDKEKNDRSPITLKIPICTELRNYLMNYVFPDSISGGVSREYRCNPRYKMENKRPTIGIPETGWAEFLSILSPHKWIFIQKMDNDLFNVPNFIR